MSSRCGSLLHVLRRCEAVALPQSALARPCSRLLQDAQQSKHNFSTALPRRAGPSKNYKVEKAKQDAIRSGQIPEDVGLLPDTFIMPYGKNRPSWTSSPRLRWRLERKRLQRRMMDALYILYYRWMYMAPRPRLHLRQIPRLAETMHKTMYHHFAAGNLESIQSTILPGFLGKLRARISQRPSATLLRWTLHEHKSPPRLVSYRPAFLPGSKGERRTERKGIVQAVIRLHTLQSLQRVRREAVRTSRVTGQGTSWREVLVDAHGRSLPDTEETARRHAKELIEYVVLQKTIRNSKEGPWKLWGTTEETTPEKLAQPTGKKPGVAQTVAV